MRRPFLDVMRGVAVLIMVHAHTLDSWTRDADRGSAVFGDALIVGGFGAPLFLFLAGVAVPLSAASKLRNGLDRHAAARAVQRRGWQIFGLAFLFRLQAYLLSPGSHASGLLKVDILNIMGPAIVIAAVIWGWCQTIRMRVLLFTLVAGAVAMSTPLVRAAASLNWLPVPLEAYLRPVPGLTNFTTFPWIGFVFAGGAAGTLIGVTRTADEERRINRMLAIAGATLCAAGYVGSLMPPLYQNSNFWTSSPTFFAIRVGIISVALALVYEWQRRFGSDSLAAIQLLGRSSLFVYWIHVEMVYGVLAAPIRHRLLLSMVFAAYLAFMCVLYGIVRVKNTFAARLKPAREHGFEASERAVRSARL